VNDVVNTLFSDEVKEGKKVMLYFNGQYLNPYTLIKSINYIYNGTTILVHISDPISGEILIDEVSKKQFFFWNGNSMGSYIISIIYNYPSHRWIVFKFVSNWSINHDLYNVNHKFQF